MLDLALFCFGQPEEVESLYSDVVLKERVIGEELVKVDAEDCVFARLRMNGAEVFLQSDLITPSFMNTVEVHGDNGSFFGSILSRFPTTVYCMRAVGGYGEGENLFHFPQVNLIERELRYFVGCVMDGRSPETNSVEESIRIIQITDELHRKSELRRLHREVLAQEWRELRAPRLFGYPYPVDVLAPHRER